MLIGKNPIGTVAYMGGVMSLPEPFVWSWTQMLQYNGEYMLQPNEEIFYTRATVSYHSFARNSLVDQLKGDWLLMLDTDMTFEPDIVQRMLFMMDKHGVDVISGIYQFKKAPHMPVMYVHDNKTKQNGLMGKWDKDVDLFEIGSSGAGCLLVKKSVYSRIKEELKENPFDIIPPFSEDHSFFERIRKLKIKAYCSPSIALGHLTLKSITLKDYDTKGLTFSNKQVRQGFK